LDGRGDSEGFEGMGLFFLLPVVMIVSIVICRIAVHFCHNRITSAVVGSVVPLIVLVRLFFLVDSILQPRYRFFGP